MYRRKVHLAICKKEVIIILVDIIKRDGSTLPFDLKMIADAVSKAHIRAEQKKVEKDLGAVDLLMNVGGFNLLVEFEHNTRVKDKPCSKNNTFEESLHEPVNEPSNEVARMNIYEIYDKIFRSILNDGGFIVQDRKTEIAFLEYERLLKRREELRALRKMKIERVSEMIRLAWKNRNSNVGRSNTGSVTDLMLLSMPIPPTSVAAISSLKSGGAVIAIS